MHYSYDYYSQMARRASKSYGDVAESRSIASDQDTAISNTQRAQHLYDIHHPWNLSFVHPLYGRAEYSASRTLLHESVYGEAPHPTYATGGGTFNHPTKSASDLPVAYLRDTICCEPLIMKLRQLSDKEEDEREFLTRKRYRKYEKENPPFAPATSSDRVVKCRLLAMIVHIQDKFYDLATYPTYPLASGFLMTCVGDLEGEWRFATVRVKLRHAAQSKKFKVKAKRVIQKASYWLTAKRQAHTRITFSASKLSL
ncbi:hypothetical protein C8F04DRAFT_1197384 [Mycena alexandri]|uniref:Uncharacterized protein n=1 Tax=Mycena alexandri TaxID=1745969 RepID=A0AAD6S2K6_9AGAR|nr:hypothetical protein C8F04DRAFT_1197384 [Mycena alexandri]